MSYIPGSGAGVIAVIGGQGISASGTAAVTVSANLTAGPGIVLGAGPGGSVQITAAGPSGNITAIGTSNGAGIIATTNVGTGVCTLDRGLFNPPGTGSGILLTESTSNAELYISNAQSVDSLKGAGAGSSNGTGITVTPYVSGVNKTFGVSANLVSGAGISIAPSSGLPGNTGLTIANTGVVAITPGAGIGASGTSNVTLSNTGVTALTAGAGVALSGSTGNVTISAAGTGVAAITAGPGISVTGSVNNPTVSNTGVTLIAAGNGIAVTGGTGGVTVSSTDAGRIIGSQSFNSTAGGITIGAASSVSYNVTIPPEFDSLYTLMSISARFVDGGSNNWSNLTFALVQVGGGGNTGIPPQSLAAGSGGATVSKKYDNIYFIDTPSTLAITFNNGGGSPISNFDYSVEVTFTKFTQTVMDYNSTGVATQSLAFTESLCPSQTGNISVQGSLQVTGMPTYTPSPPNATGTIPGSLVPVFYDTSSGQLVRANNAVIRYFAVATPSPTGIQVQITDPQGNTYSANDWLCVVAGFRNNGGDRTYECFTSINGSNNWQVMYNNAGDAGDVFIMAINRAFLPSFQTGF